jgi:hypothetical protein
MKIEKSFEVLKSKHLLENHEKMFLSENRRLVIIFRVFDWLKSIASGIKDQFWKSSKMLKISEFKQQFD